MVLDFKTQAAVNLVIQLLLLIIVSASVYHAKKKNLDTHCTIMRAGVLVLIATTAGIMFPSMLGFVGTAKPELFFTEILGHHTIGLAVILLWVYINLVFKGMVKMRIRLVTVMRLALMLWVLSLLLGLHMYVLLYL